MPRRKPQFAEAPGQDSFLDVVANLVGILIILIMVIGAQATDAMVDATPEETVEDQAKLQAAVQAAASAAAAIEQDVNQLSGKIQRQTLEIEYRRKERDKMFAFVTALEQQLATEKQKLDQAERDRLELNKDLLLARSRFEDLKASRETIEKSIPRTMVLEHLPTPMAKTVFGKELHFRLQGGRVVYVPWEEFVEKLKTDAPEKVWKLKNSASMTETLGPIRGFRMEYTLRHAKKQTTTGGEVTVQGMVELERFVLLPMRDDLGEPLAQALQPGSEFSSLLKDFDPDRTTITVWVYPDSFNDFRGLKADLFRRGFLAAGRPMPAGYPIGGSPEGTRSAAQ